MSLPFRKVKLFLFSTKILVKIDKVKHYSTNELNEG